MGQLFSGGLTNAGVYNPSSGQTQFGGPQQLPGLLSQAAASGAQPASADVGDSGVNFNQPTAQNPQEIHPSFQQAASLGATPGGGNAMSPALTKGGKLLTLLTSGLQGALAGRAASEQAIIQSGGRRSAGAGTGFEAGYTLPWQRAQQLAKTQVAVGGAQPVQTPYGQMPAALASKILTPYLGYQGRIGAAQIGGQSREAAAQTGAQGRVAAAEVNRRFMAVPGVGLFDTNSRQVVPGTANSVTVTPEIAQQYGLPQDFLGKQMTLQNLSSLEGAAARNEATVQGAEGPALVTKSGPKKGQTTKLGLGNPGIANKMAGGVLVADPNNPGNITYSTLGNAIKSGASSPQSATTQTAKATARSVAPGGKVGEEINAFNTAIQHADLLSSAVKALGNGDQQTINSLKNRFKNEFGVSGPVTAQAIADAYTREVTKMLSSGHLTDSEIGTVGATLNPSKQSPEQMAGVIDAYKALASSKMNVRRQGVQRGLQGQANFPTAQPAQGGGKDSLGIR